MSTMQFSRIDAQQQLGGAQACTGSVPTNWLDAGQRLFPASAKHAEPVANKRNYPGPGDGFVGAEQ